MSQENVELVRRLLDLFAEGEHEAVFALYDPDIEWDATNDGELVEDQGARTYWRQWLWAWRDIEFELDDVLDAGDEVVALIRNQRKVVRRCAYPDHRSPLEAAGLSE